MRLYQKLPHNRIRGEVSLPCVTYEPAALKEWPTGWQIEYRVLNPDTLVLEKKRIRFEKIRKRLHNDVQARKHAKVYCAAITRKLTTGWTPYAETRNVKSFCLLSDAMRSFLREKETDLANGVFRSDSMRTYRSQISAFSGWLEKNRLSDIRIVDCGSELITRYLDYVYMVKKTSPRTWNNYMKFLRTLWGWFIEKNYCESNPPARIKVKPQAEKERVVIPPEWSSQIMAWFRENCPVMELICGLIYNSFMRPSEICRTQLLDIRLEQNGIRLPASKTKNRQSIVDSFETQSLLNPRLGRKVGHISLNFSTQDAAKISDAFMVKIAGEYMQKMGIVDTQFIVVRHNDRERPHCHIVFNRVDNEGKTISDKNDRVRSVKACRAITERRGLYIASGKENVNRQRLRDPDSVKYAIYYAVKAALPNCKSWDESGETTIARGLAVTFKYSGGTDIKQGVIFGKDGFSFNGSKIDRAFSFSKLDAALNANAQTERVGTDPCSNVCAIATTGSLAPRRNTAKIILAAIL